MIGSPPSERTIRKEKYYVIRKNSPIKLKKGMESEEGEKEKEEGRIK
jgi:hypothetical protein